MMTGKTAEEIRKLFNVVNDYTPEEEAKLRRENEWAADRESSRSFSAVRTLRQVLRFIKPRAGIRRRDD